MKTVESSILYFSAQLEDDKTNASQKCGNLRKRLENMVLVKEITTLSSLNSEPRLWQEVEVY